MSDWAEALDDAAEPVDMRRRAPIVWIALAVGIVLIVPAIALLWGGSSSSGDEETGTPFADSSLEVAVSRQCLAPGDEQTLEVNGEPGMRILYQAVYADGKHGFTTDYYGGNDRGELDASGQFEGSWRIGEAAPAGPVTVQVVSPSEGSLATVEFRLATKKGECQ